MRFELGSNAASDAMRRPSIPSTLYSASSAKNASRHSCQSAISRAFVSPTAGRRRHSAARRLASALGAARRTVIGSFCAFQSSGGVGIAIGSSVIAIAAIRRGANGPSCIMPATVSARSPFSSHTQGVSSQRNPVGSSRRFGSRSPRRPISAKSNRHDSTS